ncbi:MAG: hypothetical protein RIS64_748 [Bacteroidota bacterium]|jgi:hypothetical protein
MSLNLIKQYEHQQTFDAKSDRIKSLIEANAPETVALQNAKTKNILYIIFSVFGWSELTAAITFYVATVFGFKLIVACVAAAFISFGLHYIAHSLLSNTCTALTFAHNRHSNAMSKTTVLSVILTLTLFVFFIYVTLVQGINGFKTYRIQNAPIAKTVVDSVSKPAVSLEIFTKKGQLITERANAYANVKNAENAENAAKTTQKKQHDLENAARYDKETEHLLTAFGGFAIITEILLIFFAYGVASDKRAATIATESENAANTPNGSKNTWNGTNNGGNGNENGSTNGVNASKNGVNGNALSENVNTSDGNVNDVNVPQNGENVNGNAPNGSTNGDNVNGNGSKNDSNNEDANAPNGSNGTVQTQTVNVETIETIVETALNNALKRRPIGFQNVQNSTKPLTPIVNACHFCGANLGENAPKTKKFCNASCRTSHWKNGKK